MFCLGNCALGPSGMLDGRLHGRLDGDRIAALTGGWRMTTVWVPADAAAVSVGADEVARALADAGATVRRNGSRGMLWAEPLVEVETDEGRVGYANVTPEDAAGVLDGEGECVGVVADHEWLAGQRRVSFARVGVIDPQDVEGFEAHGGWAGLRRALALDPEAVVAEVTDSGLRGRGGAGFPAGVKWKTVLEAEADTKFVACNFDEGDSGTFADRMVVEGDPFTLIEGMTIAAYAVGASEGYVYVRSEYPHAITALRRAIETAYTHGFLGRDILGSGTTSTSTYAWGQAPTSAARSPRCWRASRAGAARCGPGRRSRRSRACSACRPPSTTC